VFLVAVVTFKLVFHAYLGAVWIPLADSASNDMLVLEAKRLALLHGNYSRVGFYHPGPHLFYLMAAGEFLFRDLLGIAKSTEAAQQLAVICLSIVILQIVERVYRDLADDLLVSLCATAATALSVVLMVPEAFTSMWAPYTYVMAALLFFVGAAALIAGHFRWLWVFVLGSAMLVSGHASFLGLVPMMGVVLVGAIVAFQPQTRSLAGIRTLAAEHRGSVIASVVILAILLLPIILYVVLHFPGEFPEYLEFSGKQPRKGWMAVAYVLLPYWKFVGVAAIVFFTCFVTAPVAASAESRRRGIAVAAVAIFVAGTGAVIFYIQKGIDVIADYTLYLVWWYQAVPATCVGLAVAYVGTLATRRLPFLATFLMLLCAALWLTRWPVPGGNDMANVEKTMALLRQKSRASGRPVRIALDVKPSFFVDVWARAIALIAEQERRGEHIACIEEYNWHLSYHERNRCPPANPNELQIRYVGSYDDLAPIGGSLVGTFVGLRLYDFKPANWPRERINGPWVGLSEDAANARSSTADPDKAIR
jgi:hypothetical protein